MMINILLSFAMIFLGIALIIASIEQWQSEKRWGYETKRAAFFNAFQEWSLSNDWLGYSEIPREMYEDLIHRLELVGQYEEKEPGQKLRFPLKRRLRLICWLVGHKDYTASQEAGRLHIVTTHCRRCGPRDKIFKTHEEANRWFIESYIPPKNQGRE